MREIFGDPHAALAAAVLVDAVKLTRRGDGEAASWLAGAGLDWLDAIGLDLDPDFWSAWVACGCPKLTGNRAKRQRRRRRPRILGIRTGRLVSF